MSAIEDFRRRKDEFFAADERSPLTPEQRAAFHALSYFPEDPALEGDGAAPHIRHGDHRMGGKAASPLLKLRVGRR